MSSFDRDKWRIGLMRWTAVIVGILSLLVGIGGAGRLATGALMHQSVYADMLPMFYDSKTPLESYLAIVAICLVALIFATAIIFGFAAFRWGLKLRSRPSVALTRKIIVEISAACFVMLSGVVFEGPVNFPWYWQLPIALLISGLLYFGLKNIVFYSWFEQSPNHPSSDNVG